MRRCIDVDDVVFVDMDMISSINEESTSHIEAVFIVNSTSINNNKKILLLMEQGEGECFYC